jgi:uncharacterized repeat protein (TIGR03803 family)
MPTANKSVIVWPQLAGMFFIVAAAASPAVAQYALTTLASFNDTDGYQPQAGLTLSGSTLFGTTEEGGANGDGEVFSLSTAGGTPTVLASFNSTDGAEPTAGLTLSGSTLYGTTSSGGAHGDGEVFSISTAGGTPTVLASFNGTDGGGHAAGLTLSGTTLYGTTEGGGANNDGEVFSLPTAGGTPTVLASFNYTDGYQPQAGVTLSGSTLYGTTFAGANGDGEVFSLSTAGGTPTALVSFNGTDGAAPAAGLTLSGSTLYGTTDHGGANGDGTVFELSPAVITLSASAPTGFGNSLGTLTITGHNGSYVAASESFASTQNGYVLTSTWNPTTDSEIYALVISDSVSGNLQSDLALLASQIDDASYNGFSVSASTSDPTLGDLTNIPPGGFNFFLTFTDPTLGSSSDYFGFDLSEFDANSDVLSASAVAVVPEPTTLSLIGVFGALALRHRRRKIA